MPSDSGVAIGVGDEPDVVTTDDTLIDDTLIDDFEDDNTQVAAVGGRNGYWFAVNDGTPTGVQTPAPGGPNAVPTKDGADGSNMLHTSGSGFTDWGASVGASLAYDTNDKQVLPYDGSRYDGIRFTYTSSTPVTFDVPTFDTQRTDFGGACSDSCGDGPRTACLCEGHYQVVLPESADLTTVTIRWSDLYQPSWALPVKFDATRLWGVQWFFPPGRSFDFWLDDVAFWKSGGGTAPIPPPPIIVDDFEDLNIDPVDPRFDLWYADTFAAVSPDGGQPSGGFQAGVRTPGLDGVGDIEVEWSLQDVPDGRVDGRAVEVYALLLGHIDLSRYTHVRFKHRYEHSDECESIAQFSIFFRCSPLNQSGRIEAVVPVSSTAETTDLALADFVRNLGVGSVADCLPFVTSIGFAAWSPLTDGACGAGHLYFDSIELR